MQNKTIIVPSYARNTVMNDLLKESDCVFGQEVLSLSAYKSSLLYEQTDKKQEVSRLYADIQNKISKDNPYRDQLRFPVFFYYFYNFANNLVGYDIGKEDLPDHDKDKKEILAYFLDQDLIEKKIRKVFHQLKSAEGVEIKDYFYTDYTDKRDLELLKEKGAERETAATKSETVFEARVSNNNVREVTGIAQYLISKKDKDNSALSDYVLMVNNKDDYYPIIERVFTYYHIPFELSYMTHNTEAKRLLAFLQFIRKQDISTFVKAYDRGVFFCTDNVLSNYIKDYDLTYEQLLQPINRAQNILDDEAKKDLLSIFDLRQIEKLAAKEKSCEGIMKVIRKTLLSDKFIALKDKPLKDQCSYAYNYLNEKYKSLSKSESEEERQKALAIIDELKAVHDLCMAILGESSTEDDLFALLSYELDHLKTRKTVSYENGIKVTDAYEGIKNRKKAIILGCCQQYYPRNPALTGFFDEEYIAAINKYPSLVDRCDYFDSEYDRLLKSFDQVIFSYAAATVDGDKLECSTLVSEYVKHDADDEPVIEAWPYSEKIFLYNNETRLSAQTAEKLFLKEDETIKASPSAFEGYIKCPFKFFLERGLYLDDEKNPEINAGLIGNIQHRLLEKMFRNEIDLTPDNVEEKLSPYFDLITAIMPNNAAEIVSTKKRLAESLAFRVQFLTDFRKNDDREYHTEEEIKDYIYKTDKHSFKIHGFIDRLDLKDNKYRIIDYKSSDKSAGKSYVTKGINFQLLNYLLFYFDLKKEEFYPEMFAYLSLKNEKLEYKKDKTEEEIRREDIRYDAYLVDSPAKPDPAYFAEKKDKYSRDDIKRIVQQIYDYVADNILSGNIDIDPEVNECNYCNFKDICHFRGQAKSSSEMKVIAPDKQQEGEEDVSEEA